MHKSYLSYAFSLGLLASVGVIAQARANDRAPSFEEAYFTIGSVEVQAVPAESSGAYALDGGTCKLGDPTNALGEVDPIDQANVEVDKIINLGKKIWAIVEANKPVVSVQTNVASAMPAGSTNWLQLEGWQAPRTETYRIVYKNLFGMKVTEFAYRIVYTYGGSVKGVGQYLSQVTVEPAYVDVAWGYKFNANIEIPETVNMGTSVAPLAGMQIDVKWSVDTVMKHNSQVASYFVRGNGEFSELK